MVTSVPPSVAARKAPLRGDLDSPVKSAIKNRNGLPRLHDRSSDADIRAWLAECNRELVASGRNQDLLLSSEIYSFKDGQEKTNNVVNGSQRAWYPNLAHRRLFSDLLNMRLEGRRHKCGLLVCINGTWVGKTRAALNRLTDHVAVVFILKGSGRQGKTVAYWDSDTAFRVFTRQRELLEGLRRDGHVDATVDDVRLRFGDARPMSHEEHLPKMMRKAGTKVDGVWIGGDGNGANMCLPLALDWLLNFCRGAFGEIQADNLEQFETRSRDRTLLEDPYLIRQKPFLCREYGRMPPHLFRDGFIRIGEAVGRKKA